MKLPELVDYLASPRKLKALCRTMGISQKAVEDSEATIYMVDALNMESEVSIFDGEEVGEQTAFQKDGIQYEYLLEVYLAVELLEDTKSMGGTNLEKAERVLHYAIYDA